MAEAFFEAMAPPGMRAASAGTRPGAAVSPVVAEAMMEVGIDMSARAPKALTGAMISAAGRIVNMGCMAGSECPALLVGNVDDWGIADPNGLPIEDVRRIRDDVRGRVAGLIGRLKSEAA